MMNLTTGVNPSEPNLPQLQLRLDGNGAGWGCQIPLGAGGSRPVLGAELAPLVCVCSWMRSIWARIRPSMSSGFPRKLRGKPFGGRRRPQSDPLFFSCFARSPVVPRLYSHSDCY